MKVRLFSDGAARGNPSGPGGFGTILQYVDGRGVLHEREYSAGYKKTTNNRMELMAAITALTVVHNTPGFANAHVTVNIDSQYVKNGITTWIKSWKAKGWRTADKKPVKNQDLWVQLDSLNAGLNVTWNWVKGHAGIEYNEICDQLCQAEIAKFE